MNTSANNCRIVAPLMMMALCLALAGCADNGGIRPQAAVRQPQRLTSATPSARSAPKPAGPGAPGGKITPIRN